MYVYRCIELSIGVYIYSSPNMHNVMNIMQQVW